MSYDPDQPDSIYNMPGPPATIAESVDEYARNVGQENPDQEWILSPFDSWEKNPFFTGTPGRHPEDDSDCYDDEGDDNERPYYDTMAEYSMDFDDEIPF